MIPVLEYPEHKFRKLRMRRFRVYGGVLGPAPKVSGNTPETLAMTGSVHPPALGVHPPRQVVWLGVGVYG